MPKGARGAVHKGKVIRMAKQPSKAKRKPAPRKKVTKTPKQSERTLHMLAQQWLVKSGWWDRLLIFHVPNERRGGIGTAMHFKRLGVRPGVADYLVFAGRDAAIELKDEDGKQSETQKEFQRDWEKSGRLYVVVRTLEEFQGAVCAIGVFA